MTTVAERLPDLIEGELPVVRFEAEGASFLARLRICDANRFVDSFLRNSDGLSTVQLDAILSCILIGLQGLREDDVAARLAACGLDLLELSPSLLPTGAHRETSSVF